MSPVAGPVGLLLLRLNPSRNWNHPVRRNVCRNPYYYKVSLYVVPGTSNVLHVLYWIVWFEYGQTMRK